MSSMPKAMTVRERQLSDEVIRIRGTYSFQLGLLLTETFIRKPWRIPLLPLTFLALNIRFLRQRNERKERKTTEGEWNPDRDCLLLYPTSEEGAAPLERCRLIAKEWLSLGGKKVVLISSHSNASDFFPNSTVIYPIQDPKERKQHQRAEWNAQCENLLSNIMETYSPARVVFDGPFPYRGIVNIAEFYTECSWFWLRPEGIANDAVKARTSMFKTIIQFGLTEDQGVVLIQRSEVSAPSKIEPVILNALGYGLRNGTKQKVRSDIEQLLPEGHQMVDYDSSKTGKYTPVLHNEHLSKLKMAVVPPNIELVSSLLAANVPILCIHNDQTPLGTLALLRQTCERESVFFCPESDKSQLKLTIASLLDANEKMRTKSYGYESKSIVGQLFKSESLHRD